MMYFSEKNKNENIRNKSRFRLFGLRRYPHRIQTIFLQAAAFLYMQQQCQSISTDEMRNRKEVV